VKLFVNQMVVVGLISWSIAKNVHKFT